MSPNEQLFKKEYAPELLRIADNDLVSAKVLSKSGSLPPGEYALHDLTPFASIRRYEEGQAILSESDIQNAIQMAEKVLRWAHAEVQV